MFIKLGSRKSHLAQEQAFSVKSQLESLGHQVELHLRSSLGDLDLDMDLSKTQDRGVFTQDFNELLESGKVDCVVHSWKDLPIEESDKRTIVATLDREDTRDLFFIKKKSLANKKWTVLTSSPRREYHLKKFFKYLSDEKNDLSFKTIRGNVPTRIKKFLDDKSADGFCIALAAIKRLLNNKGFIKDHPGIWDEVLSHCDWCVMPESVCPSAAAQGAIAIEVLKENKALIKVFKEINNSTVKKNVELERRVLKDYGGGCHLSIGVTVIDKPQGELLIKSGEHEGSQFHEVSFSPKHSYPEKQDLKNVWFSKKDAPSHRAKLAHELPKISDLDAVLVSRAEAFDESFKPLETFSAGVKTWKKLFQTGKWVNGCLDALGESSYPKDIFNRGVKNHFWLTHNDTETPVGFIGVPMYRVETDPLNDVDYEFYVWSSGVQMKKELLKNTSLQSKVHFVGLGRSYDLILENLSELNLKEGLNLFTYYDLKQLRRDIII